MQPLPNPQDTQVGGCSQSEIVAQTDKLQVSHRLHSPSQQTPAQIEMVSKSDSANNSASEMQSDLKAKEEQACIDRDKLVEQNAFMSREVSGTQPPSTVQLNVASESQPAAASSSNMQPQIREGLVWDDSGLSVEPRWSREPQIEAINQVCRRVLTLGPEDLCAVTFHAEGCFNKVYLVDTPQGKSIMRVSLPVDPGHKTRGEVTTLRWIRRMTQIPVPKVIAFDDTRDNEIGFEWILMDLLPGKSAYKMWRKMSMPAKTWFTEQIAEFQSQLFRRSLEDAKFQSIGTLYATEDISDPARGDPTPGRVVALMFFQGDRYNYDVPRGPFRSSHDWLSAQLAIIRQEALDQDANDEDEDSREEAEVCLKVATRLTALLPKIFPAIQDPPERTVLWHDDLSLVNILVDGDGKVTGVLDWECVSCEPLWVAAGMPQFLVGNTEEEEPDKDQYGDDEGEEDDELGSEGKTALYWENLMEYEKTQLRKVYPAKMKELWPQWETEVTYRPLKADFLRAINEILYGWFYGRIHPWIDAVESGTFPSFKDVVYPKA
jgi:aminoglycoside phosphotransferase (APT) family kinase protein